LKRYGLWLLGKSPNLLPVRLYGRVMCDHTVTKYLSISNPVGMNHLKKDNSGNKMAIQGMFLMPWNKEIADAFYISTLPTSMFWLRYCFNSYRVNAINPLSYQPSWSSVCLLVFRMNVVVVFMTFIQHQSRDLSFYVWQDKEFVSYTALWNQSMITVAICALSAILYFKSSDVWKASMFCARLAILCLPCLNFNPQLFGKLQILCKIIHCIFKSLEKCLIYVSL
jgi:hypothetical protein